MFSSKPTAHKTNKNSQVLTTFQSSLQFWVTVKIPIWGSYLYVILLPGNDTIKNNLFSGQSVLLLFLLYFILKLIFFQYILFFQSYHSQSWYKQGASTMAFQHREFIWEGIKP